MKYRITINMDSKQYNETLFALRMADLALEVEADEASEKAGWEQWTKEKRECAFYVRALRELLTDKNTGIEVIEK